MDFISAISAYIPETEEESDRKTHILAQIQQHGETLLSRESTWHIVSSAVVLNPALDKLLMVRHRRLRCLTWPGGHADGNPDLLQVALRETMEETGIQRVYPVSEQVLHLQIFASDRHLGVAYGLIAPEDQPVRPLESENSAVEWIPLDKLEEVCTETAMIPVYQTIVSRIRRLREAAELQVYQGMAAPLLAWYDCNARSLPWREDVSAYRVWISEIMLQQTRVEAVKPYFARFLDALPDVRSLSEAPEEVLLKLWEGLGYYNRVRNLQKAARIIMEQHGGVFPSDYDALLALPGIGAYTAGAICSIVYGHPTPAVDGNVLRVMSRLTDCWDDISTPHVKEQITRRLAAIYPAAKRCGALTQSLMELGATVCVPHGHPDCVHCPLSLLCQGYLHGTAEELPRKAKKKARQIEEKTVFLLWYEGKIAVRRRPAVGLLAGMWEFPHADSPLDETEAADWLQKRGLSPEEIVPCGTAKHSFTHREWHMTGYAASCAACNPEWEWVTREVLEQALALPSAWKYYMAWSASHWCTKK